MKASKRTILSFVIAGMAITGLLLMPTSVLFTTSENMRFVIHGEIWILREGELVYYHNHPAVVTNQALDYAEDQLGDSPGTDPAKWIAVDDATDTPLATWTELPSETTGDGMDRAAGTYVSTGTGTWNITLSFSPTASGTVELIGLFYASSGAFLFCADETSTTNYEDGDTVQVRFSLSIA